MVNQPPPEIYGAYGNHRFPLIGPKIKALFLRLVRWGEGRLTSHDKSMSESCFFLRPSTHMIFRA